MKDEFVPYSTALKLKVLGFNERCMSYFANGNWQEGTTYNSDKRDFKSVAAPTWQSAFKWFREKYELNHTICIVAAYEYGIWLHEDRTKVKGLEKTYDTYEKAQEACLSKLCEIVELKTNK